MRLVCGILLAVSAFLSVFPSTGSAAAKASQSETTSDVFRFHMPTEPTSLDPALVTANDASYFLNNVSRGLYNYSDSKGLVPEGAESCKFLTPLEIKCRLAKDAKWSDGSDVVADDYVRAFRRLVLPSAKNLSVGLLKYLVSALEINSGKAKPDSLGVKALSAKEIQFTFGSPDPDFLYKLTSSILVPIKSDVFPKREESTKAIVNGPYQVASWISGRRVRLEPNLKYLRGNKSRPPIEILFIDDDETAVRLYEQGELTFLRRLPTNYLEDYRKRPDFFQLPVARFDYVGFGEDLKDQPDLRAALSLSADYLELQKIVDSVKPPGCAGLPERMIEPIPCVKFDPVRAKKLFDALPESVRKKHMSFSFSKLGGDDVKKESEWLQGQWKKNLGINVEMEQLEQGVQLQRLRTHPTPIFRKGVHLQRPTCLAALENFTVNGADNFLKIEDPVFEKMVKEISDAQLKTATAKTQRHLCSLAVDRLLEQKRLVPLGPVRFNLLASAKFTGWSLNEMNQLDLANLSLQKSAAPKAQKN